jgi:hypothetical protein
VGADVLLRVRRSGSTARGIGITELHESFGEEFSELDRRVGSSGVIRACRSADLLNWRFWDNPGSDVVVLTARRSGELLAFLSFWTCDRRAYVVDLFGLHLAESGPALLEAMMDICKEKRISSIHGCCSPESELRMIFESQGFSRRERDARVVPYENAIGRTSRVLHSGLRWTFSNVELMV